MKFVLLFLLGLSQYVLSSDAGITSFGDFKCEDNLSPGKRDDENCFCTCSLRDATFVADESCIGVAEIKTTVEAIQTDATKVTDRLKERLETVRQVCLADNPSIRDTICPEAYLRVKSDATTCAGSPLYCDMTTRCTEFNRVARYACDLKRVCRKITQTCAAADSNGNILATLGNDGQEYTDDGSLCAEICNPNDVTPAPTAADENECDGGKIDPITGCYIPCIEDSVTKRMIYSSDAKSVANVISDADAAAKYKAWCLSRNPFLADCPLGKIVPRPDAYGCGCGNCVYDKCTVDKRFVYYSDGTTKKCKKITCTYNQEIHTATYDATDANLVGITTAERYVNYIREETEEDVDISFCTTVTTTTTTPAPVEDVCTDPCARYALTDVDRSVCIYDKVNDYERTLECGEAAKCFINDYPERYFWRAYGRCKDDGNTDDGCELGTVRTSPNKFDRRGSGCAKICKCIENPDNTDARTYGNIWVCDTIERQFDNLKIRCAAKLGADACTKTRMSYSSCPRDDVGDICDAFYCPTDTDLTDDQVETDVCRKSNTGFGSAVTVRDDTVGCAVEVCDDTTGERKTIRYDREFSVANDNTDVPDEMVKRCPKLAYCKGVIKYDPRGVCNECPGCGDDDTRTNDERCKDNDMNRDTKACVEDPREDDSRPDSVNEAIAGRARVTVGIRFCADDFAKYERDEVYGMIKAAMMRLVQGSCEFTDAQLANLRCAVVGFNYYVVDKLDSDTCDVVYLVKFVVDFSDIDLDLLKEVIACLEGIADIRYSVATEFKRQTTTNLRYDEDGNLLTDGAAITKDTTTASAATFGIYEADGSTLISSGSTEEPTSSTESTDPTMNEAGVDGYSFMFGVIASFIAMMF